MDDASGSCVGSLQHAIGDLHAGVHIPGSAPLIPPESGPASPPVVQVFPLQPGASTEPHFHAPPSHVAVPEGSCPQQDVESSPKHCGALPEQLTEESGPESPSSTQLFPLQPGASALPHIHLPLSQVAGPAGS